MISFIICSINPDGYHQFERNITQTCGVPFELLKHDNRESKWGLCKVYNHYSKIAKYDIICYIHEDVLFHTENWGDIICNFYKNNPETGCIGFAGSTIKTKSLSGWATYKDANRYSFTQGYRNKPSKKYTSNPENEEFAEVVSLDGFCIFCKKEIWQLLPFREDLFTGFHLYDISFTTLIATKFTNYVCNNILIEHLSAGSFSKDWYKSSILFHKEMHDILPIKTKTFDISKLKYAENRNTYTFAKEDFKNKWSQRNYKNIIKDLYTETKSYKFVSKFIFFSFKHSIKRLF